MWAEWGTEYQLDTCFRENREKHIHRCFFAVCFKLYTESLTLVAVLEDNCRPAASKPKRLLQEGERQEEVNKLLSLGKQKLARFVVTPQGHRLGKPLKGRF